MVFINLSNHPSSEWSPKQLAAAKSYEDIIDIQFPNIKPDADADDIDSIADSICTQLMTIKSNYGDIVLHIMGEMTLTYAIIRKLDGTGIRCLASTSERNTKINPDGSKTSYFDFVRFREYTQDNIKSEDIEFKFAKTYFCGHLNMNKTADQVLCEDASWERVRMPHETYDTIINYYYASYIDSVVEVAGNHKLKSCPIHLRQIVDKNCEILCDKFKSGKYSFCVKSINLYIYPDNCCLFSIDIDDYPDSNPEDLTYAHHLIRSVNEYECLHGETQWDFIGNSKDYITAISPLLQICSPVNNGKSIYSSLTLTGNKLKAFQIFVLNKIDDHILYELGTMTSGCVQNHGNSLSPSDEYYNTIMMNNKVSVFRNTKALALFDSYTIIHLDWDNVQDIVENDDYWYFRFLYIQAFYIKTSLFTLNNRFRNDEKGTRYSVLLHKMEDIEHWYSFSNISYNFIPQIISKSMNDALEITSETQELSRYLVQENERREAMTNNRINIFVLFLTVLTVFSAVYDLSSIYREFRGIEAGSCLYRSFVVISLIALIAIATFLYLIIIIKYRQDRKFK